MHAEDQQVFERRVLRSMDQLDGVWLRRTNNNLKCLFDKCSIIQAAKSGRTCGSGHIARMPDSKPAKIVSISNPTGTKRIGAPDARWLARSTPIQDVQPSK